MPKAFNNCVKKGGRVRTVKPNKNSFIHVCFINGKSFSGEVKKNRKKKRK